MKTRMFWLSTAALLLSSGLSADFRGGIEIDAQGNPVGNAVDTPQGVIAVSSFDYYGASYTCNFPENTASGSISAMYSLPAGFDQYWGNPNYPPAVIRSGPTQGDGVWNTFILSLEVDNTWTETTQHWDGGYPAGTLDLTRTYTVDCSGKNDGEAAEVIFGDGGGPIDPTTRALFNVTKMFADGSQGEVTVELSCNGGADLIQTFDLQSDSSVNFVSTDFNEGEMNCDVTEIVGADNYTPSYNNGDTISETGCEFEGVTSGQYSCVITNNPDPATFVINKTWEVANGEDTGGIDTEYQVGLFCINASILDTGVSSPGLVPVSIAVWYLDGTENRELTAEVVPLNEDAMCIVIEETLDSRVEVASNCAITDIEDIEEDDVEDYGIEIEAGGSYRCDVSNTLFFEGIPTLNQYGMALLALLMLGMGFVGLRRLV